MPRAFVMLVVVATILTIGVFPAAGQPQPRAGDHPDAPQVIQQATATADFNGDGRFDLAVGAPGEDVGATVDAGAVNIFYGATGSLPSSSQLLLQDNPEGGDQFGAALAEGLLTNVPGTPNTADGFSDLVVGARGRTWAPSWTPGRPTPSMTLAGCCPG